MTQLIGQYSLYVALLAACLQFIVPLYGEVKHNIYATAIARPACWAQCFFVGTAFICLMLAFINSDFSIQYVAANSHPSLPFMYRATALWGAHEGSILLWIMALNLWAVAASVATRDNKLGPLTLSFLGLIGAAFLCFLLFTSNPFLPANQALDGMDLNPLLQDPGFVFHPPMLYLGYVGFSTAFALCLAALSKRSLDQFWAKITRKFALAAWCCLTLGICLGSWWAYRVLGWGGFWFWDPVENASLLPWLTGLALIHVLLVVEKRQTAVRWANILAILSFALSMLGTFLVRSGVLLSVHSFANDPKRGLFLLLLLALVLGVSLVIYLRFSPRDSSKQPLPLSRDGLLLINSALLFIASMTILLATLYPLILETFQLNSISVGAPYFNTVMTPLVICQLILMGIAPFSRWQEQHLKRLWQISWPKLLLSSLLAAAILWATTQEINLAAFASLALSTWILLSLSKALRFYPAMSCAHAGFAILIIGILLSSLLSIEKEVILQPGQSTNAGPYRFMFIDTTGIQGANYRGIRAGFEVTKKDRHIDNLYPEKRIYTVRGMVMTHAAIHAGIFRDLYLAVGEPLEGSKWSFRVYYKPFMRWVWFGGLLMMLGGLIGLIKRK